MIVDNAETPLTLNPVSSEPRDPRGRAFRFLGACMKHGCSSMFPATRRGSASRLLPSLPRQTPRSARFARRFLRWPPANHISLVWKRVAGSRSNRVTDATDMDLVVSDVDFSPHYPVSTVVLDTCSLGTCREDDVNVRAFGATVTTVGIGNQARQVS